MDSNRLQFGIWPCLKFGFGILQKWLIFPELPSRYKNRYSSWREQQKRFRKKTDSYRNIFRIESCNSCYPKIVMNVCGIFSYFSWNSLTINKNSTDIYRLSLENLTRYSRFYIHSCNCQIFLKHFLCPLHALYPYPYLDEYSVSIHCLCKIFSCKIRTFKPLQTSWTWLLRNTVKPYPQEGPKKAASDCIILGPML